MHYLRLKYNKIIIILTKRITHFCTYHLYLFMYLTYNVNKLLTETNLTHYSTLINENINKTLMLLKMINL